MKPETEIRNLKREWTRCRAALSTAEKERDGYKARSERLEREIAEWKDRFDALLKRTPKVEG